MKMCGKAAVDSGIGIGARLSDALSCTRTACNCVPIPRTFRWYYGLLWAWNHHTWRDQKWVLGPIRQIQVIARNDATFPISDNLQVMHDKVLAGSFVNDRATPQISFSKYVNIDLGTTSLVKKTKGCSCKKGCNKGCGCKKKGLRCHSGCACNGNCH